MGSEGTHEAGIQTHQKKYKASRGGTGSWQPSRSIPTPKPVGPVLQEAHVGPASTSQPQLELSGGKQRELLGKASL